MIEQPVERLVVASSMSLYGEGIYRALDGSIAVPVERPIEQLARAAGCDEEVVRAIVGHLTRVGVIKPKPSSPDLVAGQVTGAFDGLALARCKAAAQEGTRARWRQYRAVWSWVEGSGCRREGILRHFGDRDPPAPDGQCCDVCDPELAPPPPASTSSC